MLLMRKFFLLLLLSTGFIGLSQESDYVSNELLVQLQRGTESSKFIREFQIATDSDIESFENVSKTANIYLIRFGNQSIDLNRATNELYQFKQVTTVQKNHYITQRETIPTDALFTNQWHHKNTGQTGGTIDADIDTPDAWDITTGGETTHNDTIVVCVIEGGGVDISHEDLVDNIWHNYAEIPNNGIDDDNNGYVDDFDGWNVSTLDDQVGSGSHGTRVCGMVGATGNNSIGVSGVNWRVKMMIIKGQVASNEASVLAAYDYPLTMRKRYNETFGAEGAFVVVTNASWGIDNGDPANSPLWCAMYDTLGTYGILNVAATTNSNTNVDVAGDLPTACPSQYLIGVTMTDADDVRAGSGYGPTHIDLAAPGSSVHLPVPGNLYVNTNGTSFASPCVAGAVALAYSSPCPEFISYAKSDPSGATLDMRDYVLNSVDLVANLSGEVGTGGRLNVKNLIDTLMSNCNLTTCNIPYNLHAENLIDTSATFVWDGFSTDYLFYIQEGNNPIVEIPMTNQDTIFMDTLIACTNYTTWVKSICGSDTSDFSFPYIFQTDGCCDNPALNLDYTGVDTLIISWNDILNGTQYDVRYRPEGASAWLDTIENVNSPLTIPSLDTCTVYEIQIKTTCTDSTQGFGATHLFGTFGCGACLEETYCDATLGNTNSEWIERVVIGISTSITGSNNGYYQYEDVFTTFEQGQTYPITLEPGYSGTTFTERFTVWIDMDFNGIFEASEAVLSNVPTTTVINDNITIPLTAQSGITRMRIGMNGAGTPVMCPVTSFWGEYEDYCVYIGADAGLEKIEENVFVYPNPATNELNIISTKVLDQVQIFSRDGKLVKSESLTSTSIDVSDLNPGIYILQLQWEDAVSVVKFVKQ